MVNLPTIAKTLLSPNSFSEFRLPKRVNYLKEEQPPKKLNYAFLGHSQSCGKTFIIIPQCAEIRKLTAYLVTCLLGWRGTSESEQWLDRGNLKICSSRPLWFWQREVHPAGSPCENWYQGSSGKIKWQYMMISVGRTAQKALRSGLHVQLGTLLRSDCVMILPQ